MILQPFRHEEVRDADLQVSLHARESRGALEPDLEFRLTDPLREGTGNQVCPIDRNLLRAGACEFATGGCSFSGSRQLTTHDSIVVLDHTLHQYLPKMREADPPLRQAHITPAKA